MNKLNTQSGQVPDQAHNAYSKLLTYLFCMQICTRILSNYVVEIPTPQSTSCWKLKQ